MVLRQTDVVCHPLYFGKEIDIVLDIKVLISEPSTIVDLTDDEFTVIRHGKGEINL